MTHLLDSDWFSRKHMIDYAWCLDIDGTLVTFEEPIEGASMFVKFLLIHEIPFVIISNTGQKNRQEVASTLQRLLDVDIPPCRIFTACDQLSEYLIYNDCLYKTILVHGPNPQNYEHLLHMENVYPLVSNGIYYTGESVSCVAIFFDGFLPDFYECLTQVANFVICGAHLLVTSRDSSLMKRLNNHKWFKPGPGTFIAAIEEMVPNAVIKSFGKEQWASHMNHINDCLHTQGFMGKSEQIIIVGDKFDTDMSFGLKQGTKTCLVESGCDSEKSDHALNNKIDMVASSIKDIPLKVSEPMFESDSYRETIQKFLRTKAIRCLNSVSANLSLSTKNITNLIDMINEKMESPPRRIKSLPARLDTLSDMT